MKIKKYLSIFAKRFRRMGVPLPSETELRIHIRYSKSIEVNEFANTLNSIGSLYSSFVQKNGGSDEMAHAKLYVRSVQEGSIIIFLQELISGTIIPFVDNVNTIVDFVGFIKSVVDYFIHGIGEKPQLSIQDCQNFNNMFALTAGDNNGLTEIGAVNKADNGNIFVNCTFNYTESNGGQNQINKEIERLKSIAPRSEDYHGVLMIIDQMRGDITKDSGNKAQIDAISKRKYPVVFATDELKKQILDIESNPTKKAFYVDASVQTINDKIAAYKILALHDIIDLQE